MFSCLEDMTIFSNILSCEEGSSMGCITCDQNLSRMLPSLLWWFLLRFCLQTSGQAVLFYAHLISIFFITIDRRRGGKMSCCLIYLGVLPIFLLLIPLLPYCPRHLVSWLLDLLESKKFIWGTRKMSPWFSALTVHPEDLRFPECTWTYHL